MLAPSQAKLCLEARKVARAGLVAGGARAHRRVLEEVRIAPAVLPTVEAWLVHLERERQARSELREPAQPNKHDRMAASVSGETKKLTQRSEYASCFAVGSGHARLLARAYSCRPSQRWRMTHSTLSIACFSRSCCTAVAFAPVAASWTQQHSTPQSHGAAETCVSTTAAQ